MHETKKRHPKKAAEETFCAVGRRKTSVARVKLYKGEGKITINGRDHEVYVAGRHILISEMLKPLKIANVPGVYSIDVIANGGGVCSQAGAIKLGIARALVLIDPSLKSILGKAGCLVRDPRTKERKKYGQKRARKRFQYTKR
ncbi:MAG: 30S ribosomal protein S9 [Candidatus Saganbacteria bacterium]|nr:30S ribosomal protein S9 [Candidatus Saganbacteria bacterium]